MDLRAIVIVDDTSHTMSMLDTLSRKGFSGIIASEPRSVLDACKTSPPTLVIVEDRLRRMTAICFLSELVRLSWGTAAILVSDEEDEVVHQKTEGLGILGHIRSVDDLDGLERLLDKFIIMNSARA